MMRQADDNRHSWRLRALIVVLWRGGLHIHEALALTEPDLDPRRGSLLVRHGKGGRRREIGMDAWGWEQLRLWLTSRRDLPVNWRDADRSRHCGGAKDRPRRPGQAPARMCAGPRTPRPPERAVHKRRESRAAALLLSRS